MNVFAIVRRTLWGIVLASLLFVGCAYLATASVLLSTNELTAISNQAKVVQTIRSDTLLPRIITAAEQSGYGHLLDSATITKVFNETVPNQVLEAKAQPAIKATRDWLDSKAPDISFTIDTRDLSKQFSSALETAVTKAIATLPACTAKNSLDEAEAGVCRSPYISTEELNQTIQNTLENTPDLQLASLTNQDITVPAATKAATKNLPEYINILYAASLLTAGLALLVCLWLLSKHHLNGLITIGGAVLGLAVLLIIAGVVVTTVSKNLPGGELAQAIGQATGTHLKAAFFHQAMLAVGVGAAITLVFGGLKVFLLRRQAVHRAR